MITQEDQKMSPPIIALLHSINFSNNLDIYLFLEELNNAGDLTFSYVITHLQIKILSLI